jgi:hypothetical protein
MKTLRFVMITIGVLAGHAAGQLQQGCVHIHNRHPTTTHDSAWQRTDLIASWTTPIITNVTDSSLLLGEYTEDNPFCWTVSVTAGGSSMVTHTTSVSASATMGTSVEVAANALFAEVKAEAHASITGQAGLSQSQMHTFTWSSTSPNPPCHRIRYRATTTQYNADGNRQAAEHKIVCQNINTSIVEDRFCCKATLVGDGYGTDLSYYGQWSSLGYVACDGGCGEK